MLADANKSSVWDVIFSADDFDDAAGFFTGGRPRALFRLSSTFSFSRIRSVVALVTGIAMESIMTSLRSNFAVEAAALRGDERTVEKWTEAFIARYTEPQRHYHTLNHIHVMLECLDQTRALIENETIMKLAIFFHDWIYDPRSKNNEIDSIKCFKDFAGDIGLSDTVSSRVASYIERTITHTLPIDFQVVDSDLRLFLDYDLEVLARSDDEYAQYSKEIQAEHSHLELPVYYAGRLKVLKSFLDRDRLYFSDAFYKTGKSKPGPISSKK